MIQLVPLKSSMIHPLFFYTQWKHMCIYTLHSNCRIVIHYLLALINNLGICQLSWVENIKKNLGGELVNPNLCSNLKEWVLWKVEEIFHSLPTFMLNIKFVIFFSITALMFCIFLIKMTRIDRMQFALGDTIHLLKV